MESGKRLLKADELTILAERGLIKPSGNYSFIINEQKYSGSGPVLDFLLNQVSSMDIMDIKDLPRCSVIPHQDSIRRKS